MERQLTAEQKRELEILTHFGYEAKSDVESIDDCRIDNTNEPVVMADAAFSRRNMI